MKGAVKCTICLTNGQTENVRAICNVSQQMSACVQWHLNSWKYCRTYKLRLKWCFLLLQFIYIGDPDSNTIYTYTYTYPGRAEHTKEDMCDGRHSLCLDRVLNEKKPPHGCVRYCMCMSPCSTARGSAPSWPNCCWMQSRQHQAKANDYKASLVTAAQAVPGEWPCTAAQPQPQFITMHLITQALK